MKKILLVLLFVPFIAFGQKWSSTQINQANQGKHVNYLTDIEKETILYINLARLYPKDFVKNELKEYSGPAGYISIEKSPYKKSLIKHLESASSVHALHFDELLYLSAKCFAEEQGRLGKTGHDSVNCKENNTAECISYGMRTGKEIAMQLLIDHNVSSLGHRKICLDSEYNKIGLSVSSHTKHETCAVIEIIW